MNLDEKRQLTFHRHIFILLVVASVLTISWIGIELYNKYGHRNAKAINLREYTPVSDEFYVELAQELLERRQFSQANFLEYINNWVAPVIPETNVPAESELELELGSSEASNSASPSGTLDE